MALRHAAVFMKAGSYVIRPKSSAPLLIWRRSIARIVPSLIGRSYVLPVRLSVIVRVSLAKSIASGEPNRSRNLSLMEIAESGVNGCACDDRRGLRTQSARSESCERRAVFAGQQELAFAEAAFRSDEERRCFDLHRRP